MSHTSLLGTASRERERRDEVEERQLFRLSAALALSDRAEMSELITEPAHCRLRRSRAELQMLLLLVYVLKKAKVVDFMTIHHAVGTAQGTAGR